jgi:hypothetical protein
MLSDSLIALEAFREWDGRLLSMTIMGTYAAAEAFLVLGIWLIELDRAPR